MRTLSNVTNDIQDGRQQLKQTATTNELVLLRAYHVREGVAVRFACNTSVGRLDPS